MIMKRLRSIYLVVLLIVFAFSLQACLGLPEKPTQIDYYLVALEEFTEMVKTYNINFTAQTPETKDKWRANIDPIIKKANSALDTWGANRNATDAATKKELYMTAFQEVKKLLLEFKIIEVK